MISNLEKRKNIALLLDPDKVSDDSIEITLSSAGSSGTDFIFVGGSLTFTDSAALIDRIKEKSETPVILFPGNLLQLNDRADGIMLLSLISGRNPELLVGNHVIAAPFLKKMKSRVIPVGYILVNCGARTSVEYMSQTDSIPSTKTDIAVATALAGEMLGLKVIYLEAGSGADSHVPLKMIRQVRENIDIPLIVGGGIRDEAAVREIFEAGADIIVLGNGCENNTKLLGEACKVRDSFNGDK
ncbi:MAG: geranylgeranylglyceryl/heptaprenylglyceryl phosphate synthase [Bacteroidales bacterium]